MVLNNNKIHVTIQNVGISDSIFHPMFNKEQKNILGISVKENKVLASLKNTKSIFTLSKDVKIPRASLYPIIKKLFQRGLIRSRSHGNRFQYQAVPKENISEMLAKISIELQEQVKVVEPKPTPTPKVGPSVPPPVPAIQPPAPEFKPKKLSGWLKSIFKK